MERQARKESMLIPVMVILVTMYVISGILLLLLAFLMYRMDLAEPVVNGAIIAIYIIAGFFGGFLMGKRAGVKKYLWGLLMGALYYGVLLLVGVVLHQGLNGEPVHLLSTMVLCLLSATAGGMIS
ncbi:MAG: TIGR04086 family membrane protein [Lachnospiraceae bacterium]|nr:TIGR04086 family membrane protein [Lachnospiraceae bacterium]MDD7178701.1 TIGR04086 family membrane protein [bacterium]MDY5516225.1 TIGR04086 family membrane protein [Lachnospiraceae bacterium]